MTNSLPDVPLSSNKQPFLIAMVVSLLVNGGLGLLMLYVLSHCTPGCGDGIVLALGEIGFVILEVLTCTILLFGKKFAVAGGIAVGLVGLIAVLLR